MTNDFGSAPWPQKGDKLFVVGDDWWHNACLNYWSDDGWTVYTDGYKRAADILVENAETHDLDFVVFPIVFLYRQYLELSMKRIIERGSMLLDKPAPIPKTHVLHGLWLQCKAVLEQVEGTSPKEDFVAVGESIAEFDQIDPSSTAFRYPTDKNGSQSLPGVQYINVRNVAEVMDKLATFFEGALVLIDQLIDFKREMGSQAY